MKTVISLVILLVSQMALAQVPRPRLICSFDNGYFRVTDGIQRWEKYIGSTSGSQVQCGSDFGVGVGGPYFVTFWQGQITDKYVGGNGASTLLVRGHMGIAFMGSYLLVARAGEAVIEKYIGGNSIPVIEASSSLALISYGPYLYVTDGREVEEKYVGISNNPILSVGRDIGAALLGSYLMVYANGSLQDKYIGNRSATDSLEAGRLSPLVAVSTSSYFIVYDAQRNEMKDTYTGSAGRVEVRADGAYHFGANNRITRYDLATGNFTSI